MASDKELAEWLGSMLKAVGTNQAHTMVQHYILRDIVTRLASQEPRADTFLAEMFERVSGLVDQCELAGKPDIEAEMRWYAETFFTSIGKTLDRS